MSLQRSRIAPKLAAILALLVAAAPGCSKKQAAPGDDSIVERQTLPAFYDQIAADTPYAFASVKPFPYERIGLMSWLDAFGDVRANLASSADLFGDSPLFAALIEALPSGDILAIYRGIGLDPSTMQSALYGVGLFPAFHATLADPAKFEAYIARVEQIYGAPMERRPIGDASVRVVEKNGLIVAIAIRDNVASFGATSEDFAPTFLPYLVGQSAPPAPMRADDRLAAVAEEHGLLGYGFGFVDILQIARVATGAETDSLAAQSLRSILDPREHVPAPCRDDFVSMAQNVPTLVFGVTEVSTHTFESLLALENPGGLADAMGRARGALPAAPPVSGAEGALGRLALGIDLPATINVLRARAQEIASRPYQCRALAELNRTASQVYAAAPMALGFVDGIAGAQATLLDLEPGEQGLKELDAYATISSPQPGQLYNIFQNVTATSELAPIFAGEPPADDAIPVPRPLPASLQRVLPPGVALNLAMSRSQLGFALGESGLAGVSGALAAAPETAPLLRVDVNTQRLFALYERAMTELNPHAGEDPDMQQALSMMRQMRETYDSMSFAFDAAEGAFLMRTSVRVHSSPN